MLPELNQIVIAAVGVKMTKLYSKLIQFHVNKIRQNRRDADKIPCKVTHLICLL